MAKGYSELRENEFTQELESFIAPLLVEVVSKRADGHCMRVADLDEPLMLALATHLRRALPDNLIYILGQATSHDDGLFISSTKLVELRNPNPDGSLRPPLLIFLPP